MDEKWHSGNCQHVVISRDGVMIKLNSFFSYLELLLPFNIIQFRMWDQTQEFKMTRYNVSSKINKFQYNILFIDLTYHFTGVFFFFSGKHHMQIAMSSKQSIKNPRSHYPKTLLTIHDWKVRLRIPGSSSPTPR